MSTQEECHTDNPDPTTQGELITENVDDSALPVNAQISPRGNKDAECFASGIKYFLDVHTSEASCVSLHICVNM